MLMVREIGVGERELVVRDQLLTGSGCMGRYRIEG